MGLFDLLFGNGHRKKLDVEPERIWMTFDAKLAGISREISNRSESDTVAIVLVAHFPDLLKHLSQLASAQQSVPVTAVLARDLSVDIATRLSLDESAIIDIIVAERHPLPSVDQQLEQFAAGLPCRCRFAHHLSMEDAVIQVFAGEWVQTVLEKLGMPEDEAIESSMVSRRIRQAQQRIEGKASGDSQADSALAWLKMNCPQVIRD